MLGIIISMALLGLLAVDPIGIAVMPILLLQKKPYIRSFVFLAGSFVSLMTMGLVFTHGLGTVLLRFDSQHTWLIPSIEAIGGIILLSIAALTFWRLRSGKTDIEPPDMLLNKLSLPNWQLFLSGALLVAVQSLIDIVFVVAMIHLGQLRLQNVALTAAVTTYACAALALQVTVVVAYRLTPLKQRAKTLEAVRDLLNKFGNQTVVAASLVLGCLLIYIAINR